MDDSEIANPIPSGDKEPDFTKMAGGNKLGHLKIMGSEKVDIRKGISIEKNIKMESDGRGGLQAKQEFDVIQHQNSEFEGVQGTLLKQKPGKQSKAALESFANAGGNMNRFAEKADRWGASDSAIESESDVSVLEFSPDGDWETNNNCSRWIVIDGIKQSSVIELESNIDIPKYIMLDKTINEIKEKPKIQIIKTEDEI